MINSKLEPTIGEIEEARKTPSGWVYRLRSDVDPDGRVPPEAIVGAWKVDDLGKIVGEFIPNPKFKKLEP